MSESVVGNLWVRIKADLSEFKESMSTLGNQGGGLATGMGEAGAAIEGVEQTTSRAADTMGIFGRQASRAVASAGGFSQYGRMLGQAFSVVGSSVTTMSNGFKQAGTGLQLMGSNFLTARAQGVSFAGSMKAAGLAMPVLSGGLKIASMALKEFAVSIAMAMLPLVAIMLVIQAAMWLWDKHKEAQERAEKQMQATNLAVRSLGISMDDASDSVRKYGNAWSTTAQQMLAYGHSATEAAKMSSDIYDLAQKLKDGGLGLGNVEDEAKRLSDALGEGIDGLKHYGVYMTEAQLKAYALEQGIIQTGQAMDYASTQAAMLSAITEKLLGGPRAGIPITDDMKDAAKAADDARKSIGLMSFDSLNAIKKQEDESSKNPLEGLYADLAYNGEMSLDALNQKLAEHLNYWQRFTGWVTNGWNSIKGAGEWAWNGIKSIGESAWNGLKSAGEGAWYLITQSAAPWLGQKWNDIKGFAASTWDTVKSLGSSVWNAISGAADMAWKGANGIIGMITSAFKGAVESIAGFFGNLWDRVKSGFSSVTSSITGALGGITSTIGGFGSWLGSKIGLGGGSTTGLASGGAALPGKPGLVTIGDNMKEPEIVAPQSYIADAVADALSRVGGGGSQTIAVNLILDGVTVAKQIVRPLTQEQRRLGI